MPEHNTETWVPVPGWSGFYEVSDRGRVRAIKRPGVRGQWEAAEVKP